LIPAIASQKHPSTGVLRPAGTPAARLQTKTTAL
jgi:hypothetical protein